MTFQPYTISNMGYYSQKAIWQYYQRPLTQVLTAGSHSNNPGLRPTDPSMQLRDWLIGFPVQRTRQSDLGGCGRDIYHTTTIAGVTDFSIHNA